jgi:hypothetical protein
MFSSAFGEALNLIGTADAKSDFFLTPADLRFLNVRTIGGGLGCGAPMKFYEPSELRVAAIRKYGEAGFQKKLESRQKRESNKRRREDEADRALAVLHQTARAPTSKRLQPPSDGSRALPIHLDSDDDTPSTAPAAVNVAPPETAALRKSLLNLAKKALGFTDSGSPKNWRVEAPGIQTAVFAALAGRPADAALRTFVKAGAYYSHEADACELFGCKKADLLRIFKHEGVGIQMYAKITLKFKPSDLTLALLGGGEIICDEHTMRW